MAAKIVVGALIAIGVNVGHHVVAQFVLILVGPGEIDVIDMAAQIRQLRSDGLSLRAIARTLDDDGVATGHGALTWGGETVRRVLNGA